MPSSRTSSSGYRNEKPRRDQISPEHAAWNKLRKTARWERLRAAKLRANPLCERHQKLGRVVPATVVHHKTPHKGDPRLFFAALEDLESLCKPCHDSDAQREDIQGFSSAVGNDGVPLDPHHPFNQVTK
jgi:5-methylcytosine-specific restriction protein A